MINNINGKRSEDTESPYENGVYGVFFNNNINGIKKIHSKTVNQNIREHEAYIETP